jgi:large subunit ribosomal protein L25
VPVRFVGTAPGVQKGGKLISKLRKIKVKALPGQMPDHIDVDLSNLELGKSIKVGDLMAENYALLNNPSTPIVSVELTRAMRGKAEQ